MSGDKWFEKAQELEILVDRIKNHCEVADKELQTMFDEAESGKLDCEEYEEDLLRAEGAQNIVGQVLQMIEDFEKTK